MQVKQFAVAALGLSMICGPMNAHAAGYEKAALWHAKWTALGGAATGAVNGSESLYFNPAGLAGGKEMLDLSANFSPTFAKFEGPLLPGESPVEGNREFKPVSAGFLRFKLTDQLGLGAGVYVSGGSAAGSEIVAVTGFTAKPDFATELSLVEYSLGLGYDLAAVADGLKLGLAWRALHANARFASATAVPGVGLIGVDIKELADTRFNGWRVGLQYAPTDSQWGLGVTYRSRVDFLAKSTDVSGKSEIGGTKVTTTGTEIAALTSFPEQVAIGGYFDPLPSLLRTYLEYSFTRYAINNFVDFSGSFTARIATVQAPDIQQNWNNQHNGRIGLEYMGFEKFPIRAGYVYTSQVTPDDLALGTFASPGAGHLIALGTGTTFMGDALGVDIAGEYSFASGEGQGVNSLGQTIGPGKYKSNAFTGHLTVSYKL